MIMDYDTLRVVWWLFLGLLLIGFAITDGFDLGVAVLLPFLGRDDEQRRVLLNAVGPTWEGNQVWFVTGGGALFAAWPLAYATAFSGFYFALLLTLFALFFRPIGFDYRSKPQNPHWRSAWDWVCSSAASCRRWYSAWLSGICCKGCRSISMKICAPTIWGRCWAC